MGKVKEMMMEQQNNDREQDFLIAELDHENRLMRARNETVSYTHLTLPTILRV